MESVSFFSFGERKSTEDSRMLMASDFLSRSFRTIAYCLRIEACGVSLFFSTFFAKVFSRASKALF